MNKERSRRVIALGFFDGVHRGHATLLRKTAEVAKRLGAHPAVVTFDIHPKNLVSGGTIPLINTSADRAEIMGRLFGIETVLFAHFDKAMMHMPWQTFLEDYLVKTSGAVHLVCGHDYHFGYQGQGNPRRLAEKCEELGIGYDIMERVEYEGITVTSTYIRTLIASGNIERANLFLGHPYGFTDTVRHGRGLGSRIGSPTVNLHLAPEALFPAHGVYVTRIFLQDQSPCPAVTNVGRAPTVREDGALSIESFLLDFSGDLYGQRLRIEFYSRLRPEQKFADLTALSQQIQTDTAAARAWFAQEKS